MDKSQKSPEAYRTISEVSDQLDVPQHVLRFWETKFPEVEPMKRGGNRRYYDPRQVQLLARVRDLLYVEGYTTKGVQKLLQEGRLLDGAGAQAEQQGVLSANLMDLASPSLFSQEGSADSPTASGTVPGAVQDSVQKARAPLDVVTRASLQALAERLSARRSHLAKVLAQTQATK